MDRRAVIESMEAFFQNYLEKPQAAYGNCAPCPFVRDAREQGVLRWHLGTFNLVELLQQAERFCLQDRDEVLICVGQQLTQSEPIEETAARLQQLVGERLSVRGQPQGGPRAPYPYILVVESERIKQARSRLTAAYRSPNLRHDVRGAAC